MLGYDANKVRSSIAWSAMWRHFVLGEDLAALKEEWYLSWSTCVLTPSLMAADKDTPISWPSWLLTGSESGCGYLVFDRGRVLARITCGSLWVLKLDAQKWSESASRKVIFALHALFWRCGGRDRSLLSGLSVVFYRCEVTGQHKSSCIKIVHVSWSKKGWRGNTVLA